MNGYELARIAEVPSPDSADSPGALFLARIAEATTEAIEYASDGERRFSAVDWAGDGAHDIADSAVPIYTHERWRVFVDLCAYEEDLSELGGAVDDMTQNAGTALYLIASRLVAQLAEAWDEEHESFETDDRGVVEVLDRDDYMAGHPDADIAECGVCERMWDDAVPTAWTPAPSGHCPFEYDHDHGDDE